MARPLDLGGECGLLPHRLFAWRDSACALVPTTIMKGSGQGVPGSSPTTLNMPLREGAGLKRCDAPPAQLRACAASNQSQATHSPRCLGCTRCCPLHPPGCVFVCVCVVSTRRAHEHPGLARVRACEWPVPASLCPPARAHRAYSRVRN